MPIVAMSDAILFKIKTHFVHSLKLCKIRLYNSFPESTRATPRGHSSSARQGDA